MDREEFIRYLTEEKTHHITLAELMNETWNILPYF